MKTKEKKISNSTWMEGQKDKRSFSAQEENKKLQRAHIYPFVLTFRFDPGLLGIWISEWWDPHGPPECPPFPGPVEGSLQPQTDTGEDVPLRQRQQGASTNDETHKPLQLW